MSVQFCGLRLAHPIINGSGTFDAIAAYEVFGEELYESFPFSAYVSKTITVEPRNGNPPPRLWEAQAGLINSIGLPNKGLERYLAEDLPRLSRLPVALITNVMGSTVEEISTLVSRCDTVAEIAAAELNVCLLERCELRDEIAAVELNVSCPNVKTGLDIGSDPVQLEQVLRAVRPATSKPLIVKLTPNAADVAACALAAQAAGADAVSLINTLRAAALSPYRQTAEKTRMWLGGGTGGLSGAAIRPVALAQVAAVAARVSIPVIGMGGVQSARHAQDLLDVGAALVAVGTESFRDPAAGARIARELAK
jgi:dihydroorotate dehydrogenase (NAD+) catalytic subunit